MKVWVWRKAIEMSDLKPTTKLVLYTLANYMDEDCNGCFPSIPYLANAVGVVERVIYRHIKSAEDAGLLVRKKRKQNGQEWASNEYIASVPRGVTVESGVTPGTPLKGMSPESGVIVESSLKKGQGVTVESGEGCLQSHPNTPLTSPIKKIIPPSPPEKPSPHARAREAPANQTSPLGLVMEFGRGFKNFDSLGRGGGEGGVSDWDARDYLAEKLIREGEQILPFWDINVVLGEYTVWMNETSPGDSQARWKGTRDHRAAWLGFCRKYKKRRVGT